MIAIEIPYDITARHSTELGPNIQAELCCALADILEEKLKKHNIDLDRKIILWEVAKQTQQNDVGAIKIEV